MDEKEILEGFNAGYVLEQYRPQLAKELVGGVKAANSPFVEGFIAGRQEYTKERGRNMLLTKLRDSQKKPPTISKEKGVDKEK